MARRVVTLPPGLDTASAVAFAQRARATNADVLEVRDDLVVEALPWAELAQHIPLLWSQRQPGVAWPHSAFAMMDTPLEDNRPAPGMLSFHAPQPLTTHQALETWRAVPPGCAIKHVEPLGDVASAHRLVTLQQRLRQARTGEVTVLATGPLALPFRAVLAARNALDYVALDPGFSAAVGQRLLADAVRADRSASTRKRLGIVGTGIAHSRSPRIHPAPFDRVDLPPDAPLAPLLAALHPHYGGFAVTSPFKKAAARAVGALQAAVNTLVRTPEGWRADNTDPAGAAAVLQRMNTRTVTVLGDGGAAWAVRQVPGVKVTTVVRRHDVGDIGGAVVWTWPPEVAPPQGLRFNGANVAVVAYGRPGAVVAERIRALGGTPLRLGACWFVAQARAQARLWAEAP